MNNFIYGLGGILLGYGCLKSEFKKSGLLEVCKILGLILMIIAYLIK